MTHYILVPDNLTQAGLDMLRGVADFEVYAPGKMKREETLAQIPKAHALIIRSDTKVDEELLAQADNLKVVVRAGVGVDNIDMEACTARGVVAMNTPDANTISTAELALALMLALARHIPRRTPRYGRGSGNAKNTSGPNSTAKRWESSGLGA